MQLLTLGLVIFIIAAVMSMTGRGGGNFYVLALALAGLPMHNAASTGQFILFCSSVAAALIFRRGKTMLLPLALFLGTLTASSAFMGGYTAYLFSGNRLKMIFSVFLMIAGIAMFFKAGTREASNESRLGFWRLEDGDKIYNINLWITIPLSIASGFFSGMVGVSGGSFLVPLMILACGIPVHAAAGTASAIVAATALSGFAGHLLNSGFDTPQALPLAAAAVMGGVLGGKAALKAKSGFLRILFAVTTLAAALFMLLNLLFSK